VFRPSNSLSPTIAGAELRVRRVQAVARRRGWLAPRAVRFDPPVLVRSSPSGLPARSAESANDLRSLASLPISAFASTVVAFAVSSPIRPVDGVLVESVRHACPFRGVCQRSEEPGAMPWTDSRRSKQRAVGENSPGRPARGGLSRAVSREV